MLAITEVRRRTSVSNHCCKYFLPALLALALWGCPEQAPSPQLTESGTEEHPEGDHAEENHGEDHEEGIVELPADAAARAAIRTAPVGRERLAGALQTTGQVDFDQDRLAHVSPRIAGRVHRVEVVLGQQVQKGEVLALLDSVELGRAKADYLQDEVKEELARMGHDRALALYEDRILSEQQVLEAKAELREAEAALRTARDTLRLYGLSSEQVEALADEDTAGSLYPLRAPFSGTITDRHVTLGELVTPERNLFTLADLSRVWIWVDVYQRNLGRVHLDDEVQARVDAYPDEVFTGKVSYLSAQVDVDTRTVRARLDVANAAGKLRPGMFVQVGLFDPHGGPAAEPGAEGEFEALVVPSQAVVRDGDASIVFISLTPEADGTQRFERRPVELGRGSGDSIEILGGVSEGDLVVVSGVFLLKSAASKDAMGGGHSH